MILDGADSIGLPLARSLGFARPVHTAPLRQPARVSLSPVTPTATPTRDDVVAYLEQYASTFDLPVELDSRFAASPRMDGC